MRWIFLIITILLLQGLSFAVARGLCWTLAAKLSKNAKKILTFSIFFLSNILLVLGLIRISFSFRLLAFWLTVLWFLAMALIVVKLFDLIANKTKLSLNTTYQQWGKFSLFALLFITIFSISIYNAYTPVTRYATVEVKQPLAKPIRIAMVADLHLGVLFGAKQLDHLAQTLQHEKAELLLIPGDVMDDNTEYYLHENMRPSFEKVVKSVPLGVYATLGNHDVFGHQLDIMHELAKINVHVLNDEVVSVNNQILVAGRPDDLVQNRLPISQLIPKFTDKPIILLDHRPSGIDENVKTNIALQVSGHTHNGQIFPANFIVKMLNTVAYGHQKINDTDVIVTSGYGFWGVPFRLGSQSEVWIIDVKGK